MTVGQFTFNHNIIERRLAYVDPVDAGQTKLCLIDDIFKTWRLLEAFDPCLRHISHAGELFDCLYDLPIEALEIELNHYSGLLSAKYRNLSD